MASASCCWVSRLLGLLARRRRVFSSLGVSLKRLAGDRLGGGEGGAWTVHKTLLCRPRDPCGAGTCMRVSEAWGRTWGGRSRECSIRGDDFLVIILILSSRACQVSRHDSLAVGLVGRIWWNSLLPVSVSESANEPSLSRAGGNPSEGSSMCGSRRRRVEPGLWTAQALSLLGGGPCPGNDRLARADVSGPRSNRPSVRRFPLARNPFPFLL